MIDWPAFWEGLGAFLHEFRTPLRLLAILLGAVLLRWLLLLMLRGVVTRVVSGVKRSQRAEDTQALMASPLAAVRLVQRTRTLGSVLSSMITWALIIVAVVLVLDQLEVNVTAIVAWAGVIGAALAFGAQTIIRDVINGLLMVFEDQFGVGDVVDLGPASGMIESVGARITKVRDVNGTLWFVRNGEVVRVGNLSHGWARVILDVTVPSDSYDRAEAVLSTALQQFGQAARWRTELLEQPQLWGVQSITGSETVLRVVIKTRTASRDDLSRQLRNSANAALREAGIPVSSMLPVMPAGLDTAGSVSGPRLTATAPITTLAAEAAVASLSEPPGAAPSRADDHGVDGRSPSSAATAIPIIPEPGTSSPERGTPR